MGTVKTIQSYIPKFKNIKIWHLQNPYTFQENDTL